MLLQQTTQELAIGFLCGWIFLSFRKTVITSSHNYKPILVMLFVSWIFMFKSMVLFCLFMFILRYDICPYLENILGLEWSMQAKEQLWWNRKGFFKAQFSLKKKKNSKADFSFKYLFRNSFLRGSWQTKFIPLGDVSDSQNIAQINSYERWNTA